MSSDESEKISSHRIYRHRLLHNSLACEQQQQQQQQLPVQSVRSGLDYPTFNPNQVRQTYTHRARLLSHNEPVSTGSLEASTSNNWRICDNANNASHPLRGSGHVCNTSLYIFVFV